MIIYFDIGNTRVKWLACRVGSEPISGVFIHEGADWLDSLGELSELVNVTDIWYSSVASKSMGEALSVWAKSCFGVDARHARVAERLGSVVNGYEDIPKLGVDRWMAALGAHVLYPDADVVIVDAGTAVTVDLLDGQLGYLGGVILPGVRLMHESLNSSTSGIKSSIDSVESVIGKTTQECVNSGVQFGLVGAVEKVVFEIQKNRSELNMAQQKRIPNKKMKFLITGGDARVIASHSTIDFVREPSLVLLGLQMYASHEGGL